MGSGGTRPNHCIGRCSCVPVAGTRFETLKGRMCWLLWLCTRGQTTRPRPFCWYLARGGQLPGSRPKPLKPTKLHPRAPVGACHCCARQFLKIHPVMGTLSMCKSIAACAVLHALTQGYATVCGALVARTANSYYYGIPGTPI